MADWGAPTSGSVYDSAMTALILATTPNAAAHTKGVWSDVGTPGRSGAISIQPDWYQAYTTHRTILVDFATGAAGQEQVFLSNLMLAYSAVGDAASRASGEELTLPIELPPNQLIRMRCQSSYAASAAVNIGVASSQNIPSSWAGSDIVTYGADTTASAGTTLTANAASMVFGAWATITASCQRMACFFLAVSPRTQQNGLSNQHGQWQVAIGAAGFEQIVAAGTVQAGTCDQIVHPQWFGPYFVQVAEGQRLSGRLLRQGTVQRTLDMIIYGVK